MADYGDYDPRNPNESKRYADAEKVAKAKKDAAKRAAEAKKKKQADKGITATDPTAGDRGTSTNAGSGKKKSTSKPATGGGGGGGRAGEMVRYLMQHGLSASGAAAVVGNLQQESSLNPGAVGDGGTSYGLAQWHNERWTALRKFAASRGAKASSWTTQLDFLMSELKSGYGDLHRRLRGNEDASRLAVAFMQKFERPADSASNGANARARSGYAAKYVRYAGGSGGSSGGSMTGGGTSKNWWDVLFGGRGRYVKSGNGWGDNPAGVNYASSHTGADFGARQGIKHGDPVFFPAEGGTVVKAGRNVEGSAYGNGVLVRMNNGDYLFFAHLANVSVTAGQKIKAGTKIGAVGNSGTNSSGSHLHFEVRKGSTGGKFGNWRTNFYDPEKYMNSRGKIAVGGGGTSGGGGGGGGGSWGDDSGSDGGSGDPNVTYTSSSSGYSGGGGGGGGTGFSKAKFYADLSESFGDIDTLLKMDKEAQAELGGKPLKWAIDQMVKKRIVDPSIALTYLNQTGWFKKYSPEITKRLVLEESKPEAAKLEVDQRMATLTAALATSGVQLGDDDLNKIARDAWVYNWNPEQTDRAVARAASVALDGGDWAAQTEELHKYADDYGVDLTDPMQRQWQQDYLNKRGSEGIKSLIRSQASARYPVFGERLDSGESLRSLTDAYFQQAGNLLEVDPNTIDWSDPLFANGRAFITTNANGQQVQKSLADFEKDIRSDTRWVNTKNAKEELTSGAYNLLQRFGMVG